MFRGSRTYCPSKWKGAWSLGEGERINWGKLGHKDEPSVSGLICGPKLTPATPRDVSLSLAHTPTAYAHTRICWHVHQWTTSTRTLKDKRVQKDTQTCMRTNAQMWALLSELQLEGRAALCWTLMILAVSRWVSPLLYPPPAHPPPTPFHLPFFSVFCLSVKQMCAQN